MKHIKTLGIDIAKDVFQLCGVNQYGKIVYTKRVKRANFVTTVSNLDVERVVMEACGGANHWYRTLSADGLAVKLISPQHVKPFLKSNKNDRNDAHAIAEAGSRAEMPSVCPKTLEQQDVQMLLRIRDRLMKSRTALINEIRGFLQEYGMVIPKAASKVYAHLPAILEQDGNGLTVRARAAINQLYCELLTIDEEIKQYEQELKAVFKASEICQRVETVPGVGYLTALTVFCSIGNVKQFRHARQLSAFIGLVPRQHSSGNKQTLLGISKRGNVMLRTLLIHGARSVLIQLRDKTDKKSLWLKSLVERRGMNRAAVALANKNARIIWALLTNDDVYRCVP